MRKDGVDPDALFAAGGPMAAAGAAAAEPASDAPPPPRPASLSKSSKPAAAAATGPPPPPQRTSSLRTAPVSAAASAAPSQRARAPPPPVTARQPAPPVAARQPAPPPPPQVAAALKAVGAGPRAPVRQSASATLSQSGIRGVLEYIELTGGVAEENLFKTPVESRDARQLLDSAMQANEDVDQLARVLAKAASIHVVAAAVKEHFKGLRDPVVPYALYPRVIQLAKDHTGENLAASAGELLAGIREPGRSELTALLRLLSKVTSVKPRELSYTFGVALIRPQVDTMETARDLPLANGVIQACIEHFSVAFGGDAPAPAPAPAPAARPALPPNKPGSFKAPPPPARAAPPPARASASDEYQPTRKPRPRSVSSGEGAPPPPPPPVRTTAAAAPPPPVRTFAASGASGPPPPPPIRARAPPPPPR